MELFYCCFPAQNNGKNISGGENARIWCSIGMKQLIHIKRMFMCCVHNLKTAWHAFGIRRTVHTLCQPFFAQFKRIQFGKLFICTTPSRIGHTNAINFVWFMRWIYLILYFFSLTRLLSWFLRCHFYGKEGKKELSDSGTRTEGPRVSCTN